MYSGACRSGATGVTPRSLAQQQSVKCARTVSAIAQHVAWQQSRGCPALVASAWTIVMGHENKRDRIVHNLNNLIVKSFVPVVPPSCLALTRVSIVIAAVQGYGMGPPHSVVQV